VDPFVALMRRYSIDYTASHDFDAVESVMAPSYVAHTCGLHLRRDPDYRPAAAALFRAFPGLGFSVHEIVTNGDRLAMRFSEHGMAVDGGRMACWRGFGLYRWDGDRVTECFVEQDLFSRRRQLKSGTPDALEAPHIDPWASTVPVASDPNAEAVVAAWLPAGDLAAAQSGWVDVSALQRFAPCIAPSAVVVNDLFSAGPQVAFHADLHGAYVGGCLDRDDPFVGRPASIAVVGVASVRGGAVAEVRAVTDRFGLRSRLLGAALVR
jgi:hypothetical protein